MKEKLQLKNKKVVEDLHDLKKFLRDSSQKDFVTNLQETYDWIKHNYKDDVLAQDIMECQNLEAAIYCINGKLEQNLTRKLKLLEENYKSETDVRKAPDTFMPKMIVPQPRESLIAKMKEVHQFDK